MRMIRRTTVLAVTLVSLALPARAQQFASEQDRREAVRFYNIGLEMMAHEQFEKAAEQFSKAVHKDPLLTRAHYGAGQAYMALQRFASAAKAYGGCLDAFKALHDLAVSNRFAVERQRDEEMRELREDIRRMTQSGQTLRATQAEARLRDLERQRTSLESMYRPPAAVLLALGSALYRNGNAELAAEEWQAAVESDPKLGEAHNNLAVVHLQAGRLADAGRELALAEKSGFRVNPRFKEDLKQRTQASRQF
jgi:tetratricopeptide (TPR) repeat protein